MIYNLTQYLVTNLTALNFVTNGFNPDSAQDQVMISETGGEPQHFYRRTDWAVQVLSRAQTVDAAKRNIESVYALLKNKFGILLPQVVVSGVTYPAVRAYQISPIQTPAYLGATEENLEMFSFNLTITTD